MLMSHDVMEVNMNHFFVPNLQHQFLGQQISMRRHDEEQIIRAQFSQKKHTQRLVTSHGTHQHQKRFYLTKTRQQTK